MADTEVHTEDGGNTNTPSNTGAANKRCRGWMFTWNNPPNDSATVLKMYFNKLKASYMIVQLEVGKNGTPHFQGFIYFTNARGFNALKKELPNCHLEAARGIPDCIKYCSKEDTRKDGPWEFGERPQQGRRCDLEAVAKKIIDGTKVDALALDHPVEYIRYSKGLKALETQVVKHRDPDAPFERIWIYGTAGVGKTFYVVKNEPSLYIKDGTMWWDNYNYETAILIDDFDGKWPYRDLLRLLF